MTNQQRNAMTKAIEVLELCSRMGYYDCHDRSVDEQIEEAIPLLRTALLTAGKDGK